MRILVENSGYLLRNQGDVAMLQATIAHLHAQWPSATLQVITEDAERLRFYCPQTEPIYTNLVQALVLTRLPASARPLTAMIRPLERIAQPKAQRFLMDVVVEADLVVASGGGYITDSFPRHCIGVLNLLELAQRLGKPTAMFGQGVGPLTMPRLISRARNVLPAVGLIALRESSFGPNALAALGVSAQRVVITGDDAVSAAYQARSGVLGDALGVNVRIASYSGVSSQLLGELRVTLREAARDYQAALLPLPISHHRGDSDVAAIRQLIGPITEVSQLNTPQEVIAHISRCRSVITGSYHAAVFALAQGIPVVCLTRSAYYDQKFQGLLTMFGVDCPLVELADRQLRKKLRAAVDWTWANAEQIRPQALYAAEQQIAKSITAYQRLPSLMQPQAAVGNLQYTSRS